MRGSPSRLSVSRETLTQTYFPKKGPELARYAELLETVAVERGIIGPSEGPKVWERHIENCVPITTLFTEGATVGDIGSGAGLPGIIIALARPDLKITLIEPLQRRVDFLNEVIAELGLEVTVHRGKAKSLTKPFHYVTARAVAPLARLIPSTWHLVRPNGALLAIKGESAAAELSESILPKGATARIIELNIGELPVSRIAEVIKAG